MSLPILKQMQMDTKLWKLLFAEWIAEYNRSGLALEIIKEQLVHRLPDEEYTQYWELI